jgi:hypothetical protein
VTSTLPLVSDVAVWYARGEIMLPAGVNVPRRLRDGSTGQQQRYKQIDRLHRTPMVTSLLDRPR